MNVKEDKIIEYVTANGATPKSGCSLFLNKEIADNPAVLAKLSTETGGVDDVKDELRIWFVAKLIQTICKNPL